jgi:hypothetical protein
MLAAKPKKSPLKLPVVIRYQKKLNAVHQVVDAVQQLQEEEHLIPPEEQRKNRKAFEEHNDSSVAKKLNPSEERKKFFDLLHQLHETLKKNFLIQNKISTQKQDLMYFLNFFNLV